MSETSQSLLSPLHLHTPAPLHGIRRLAVFGRNFARSRAGILGLLLTLLAVSLAFLADFIVPYSPFKAAGPPLQAPSVTHPMGTDDLGRDVLAAVVYGARTSLLVGVSVAGIAALVGTLVGTVSAYRGGWVDDALMRFTEFFQVLPRFFLAVIVIALFGAGLDKVILVLGLTSWTMIARVLRAEVLSLRECDFMVAARAIGARDKTILLRHVLPNAVPPLVVSASLLVGQAVLVEAGLSFLGLGDPSAVSWGYLLNNAQSFMRVAWWMALFPGLVITFMVLGINLAGDGLNAAWNPKLRVAG
jgi:peptide/nickel transport system permease protein